MADETPKLYTLTTSKEEGSTRVLHDGVVLDRGATFEIDAVNAKALIETGVATASKADAKAVGADPGAADEVEE